MRVRTRLIGGFFGVTALVALTGTIAWNEAHQLAERSAITEAVHVAEAIAHDVTDTSSVGEQGRPVRPLLQSPGSLAAYVERMHLVQDRDIVIVDARQRVLADAIPDNVGTVFEHDSADEVGVALRTGRPATFVEVSEDYPDGIKQVAVPVRTADGIVSGAVLIEYTPMFQEMEGLARDMRVTIVVTAGLCLAAGLAMGVAVSTFCTRRLRRLLAGVQDVAAGDLAHRVPLSGTKDEFEDLARAFNEMAERLEFSAREILAKEFTDSILANAGEGICGVDAAGRISFANTAAAAIVGLPMDLLIGCPVEQVLPAALQSADLQSSHDPADVRTHETDLHRADGGTVPVRYNLTAIRKSGTVIGAVLLLRDVTQQRALEQDLRHQAVHDSLTGLPNRTLFQDRLQHAMEVGRTGSRTPAVLFLDLDGFKRVNDSLGHNAGDQLLKDAATRLQECLRPEDTLARFGGDEFGVLLADATADMAALICSRLLKALAHPFPLGDREVRITASIGTLLDAASFAGPDEVIRNADVAMYAAKADGKARVRYFETAMHTQLVERLDLEQRLRGAVEREELVVHYQPVFDLARNEISGVEALVRWEDPERGMQPPATFIPLAEESGLIVEIDRWVLEQACRTVKAWQDAAPDRPPLSLSVNLSAAHFDVPDLADRVADVLRRTGLAAQDLVLEITETILMSNLASAVPLLDQLRTLGVRTAIDDFGTGYSSLGYLREVPADVLKIDQSFIRALVTSERDSELVEAIVGLGHTLGLTVVAEGIEDADQAMRLTSMGCESGQGYHLGRPQSEAQLSWVFGEMSPVGARTPA